MSDLYSNDKVREKAEQLVQQNIHYCVSTLISNIAQPQSKLGVEEMCEALGIDYEDDLMPILESLDYDEPATQHIRNDMDRYELVAFLQENDVELPIGSRDDLDEDDDIALGDDELKSLAVKTLDASVDCKDFCEEHRIEPDRIEVYEHWIVDNWFAGKLEEMGESVARDFLGMTIWGRPTSGQAISMDGVILQIAADLVKEN